MGENMIGYIISIILILLCLKYRNSKTLFIIMFLWMWILLAFSSGNADYIMYKEQYEASAQNGIQNWGYPLFSIMLCIFSSLYIPYNVFLGFYGLIGLTLIATTIYKLSKNKSLTAACYFIFPFVFDVVQIKNFMAMAIIIYAMQFLINTNNKKNITKYIALKKAVQRNII